MENSLENIRGLARAAHSQGKLNEAKQLYNRLIKIQPVLDDIINLGALLRSQKALNEASKFYQHWVPKLQLDERLVINACNCWNDNNEPSLSLDALNRFLKEKPENQKARYAVVDALMHANQYAEALKYLTENESNNSSTKSYQTRLGLCYAHLENPEKAFEAFTKAHEIDPQDQTIIANRITLLKDLGRTEDAINLIEKLDSHSQSSLEIISAKAGLLMGQNKLNESTYLYKQLAEKQPNKPEYWLNWASALRGIHHSVSAVNILKTGLLHSPLHQGLLQALAQAFSDMGKTELAERILKSTPSEILLSKDDYFFSRQFIGMGRSPKETLDYALLAKEWETRKLKGRPKNIWADIISEPIGKRKLRIGYLSADFANHPVGRFLLPILESHDQTTVETWLLNVGKHQDWITDHLKKRANHWLDLKYIPAIKAARILSDLQLDVIIELGGYTRNSGIGILCHKPAPIQLSYLGYPAPTYLNCIDGWVGDKVLFAKLNQTDQKAHELIEIKGGYMAFDCGGELPEPTRTKSKKFRFGSFNHARKLNKHTIALFCKVLKDNPSSLLVLKSMSFLESAEQHRVRASFEDAGVDSKRLIILNWVEGGLNHLKLYENIDVALDPTPYGGATTTAEALWMGVPVVTRACEGMVGRLSASILVHGECAEWVAKDDDEYISIASKLAAEGQRDTEQRLMLRQKLKKSPLANGKRLANELEKHYFRLRKRIKPC